MFFRPHGSQNQKHAQLSILFGTLQQGNFYQLNVWEKRRGVLPKYTVNVGFFGSAAQIEINAKIKLEAILGVTIPRPKGERDTFFYHLIQKRLVSQGHN